MVLTGEHQRLLESIRREWDQAEADIKLAEQVDDTIVMPAIMELRYAGRRIADALVFVTGSGDEAAIKKLLGEAEFDCQRARHDAIDAATTKIAIDVDLMTKKLGYAAVLQTCPDFGAFLERLVDVRTRIVTSRGNRSDRNSIYSVIETADFPKLVADYRSIRIREPVMKGMARAERAKSLFNTIGVIANVLIGLVLIWLTYLMLK